MKAFMYLGIGKMELQDIPDPTEPFIIRVGGCGICGTDLKAYLNGHHMFTPPTILGHEFYGIVERAPDDCDFKTGEAVVVAPYVECGECRACKSGVPSLCKNKSYLKQGAFCEYVGISLDYLQKGVIRIASADDVYTLVEPLACVLNGISRLRLLPDSKVLVVGGGPMGALFALVFRERGIPVTVVEPAPARREAILGWGIDAREKRPATDGEYDNIVIAVNKKELIPEYVQHVADGGTVLIFSGLPKDEQIMIDAFSIHYREVTLTGSFGYAMPHFREALSMIEGHGREFSKIITKRLPLEEGLSAFELLASGKVFKIVLKP
jgi:L-iditol 2-dehydrogenase